MLNKVQLIGYLGRDPERRTTAESGAVVTLALATTEYYRDKEGERQERTEWHRVVLFGKLAEIAGEYLKKGSLAYLEGRLRTRKWQDQAGQDRYTTEIVASALSMLDRKPGGGRSAEAEAEDGDWDDPLG